MHRTNSSTSEPSELLLNSLPSDQDLRIGMTTSYSAPNTANPGDRNSLTSKDKVSLPPLVMNSGAAIASKATGIALFQASSELQTNSSSKTSPDHILNYEQCKLAINDIMSIQLSSDVVNSISSWNFDIFPLTNYELIAVSAKIMNAYDFLDLYSISLEKWYVFMLNVENQMISHVNPYHNFRHVMDILQSCHVFLQQYKAKYILQPIDIFSMFLSALGHDLDHPGLNNVYQMNAFTPLAIRYNDVSILENHHCCRAFELFFHPDVDILSAFDKETIKYIRKVVIKAILSTDMAHHFTMKAELESSLAAKTLTVISTHISDNNQHPLSSARRAPSNGNVTGRKESLADANSGPVSKRVTNSGVMPTRASFSSAPDTTFTEKERLSWISLLVHAADIGNPGKPWHLSKQWSDLVVTEFFNQGDLEKAEQLPVSQGCDRETASQDEISLNFADFIVAPFFIALSKALPGFRAICQHIADNRMKWHEILMQRLSQQPCPDDVRIKWETRLEQSRESLEAFVREGAE
jgi:hypothetical protein